MKFQLTLAALLLVAAAQAAEPPRSRTAPPDPLAGLRGPAPLTEEPKPPRMANVENSDVRRGRAYTNQPPTIPHAIEKYEITRNVNFCMYCHTRVRNEQFAAPMVSATHYTDRDGNYLAEVAPNRYFCTQCHVPQTDVRAPLENTFVDVYDLVSREQRGEDKDEASAERRAR